MRMTHSLLAATIVASTAFLFAAAPVGDEAKGHKHDTATIGHAAPAFTLTGADGKTYNLADYKGKTVVLEWFCSSCPASGKGENSFWGSGDAAKTLTGMKAADADAVYLAIDSTKDGHQDMTTADEGKASTEIIAKSGQSVPVLMDASGKVGREYGAKTTPHIFIIDKTGNVAYIGAPTGDGGKINYIVDAVTAIKAGKPVNPSKTKNSGCGVKYASPKAEKPAA